MSKKGLEVIESTNLKYFTKEMTAEFYALKGMFLAQINKYGHRVDLSVCRCLPCVHCSQTVSDLLTVWVVLFCQDTAAIFSLHCWPQADAPLRLCNYATPCLPMTCLRSPYTCKSSVCDSLCYFLGCLWSTQLFRQYFAGSRVLIATLCPSFLT